MSYSTSDSIVAAREIYETYANLGVKELQEKVLVKLASTWESIQACEVLESEDIRTNMTLMFSLPQSVAAAERGATLISPFVGRILDWYKIHGERNKFEPWEDPGVLSVQTIHEYFRQHDIQTIIMGASFRNIEEILQLAGCDRLTISPKLMEELSKDFRVVERKLGVKEDGLRPREGLKRMNLLDMRDESTFRAALKADKMASDKLEEGIKGFAKDLNSLKDELKKMLENS
eukprot:CAMPEP_0196591916 /NCGR_PEP_ID=MMETSP1081-20130531/71303_1 /TAXON_ID=36882 /ORGANISM="Pyramimonas amylifera, Strain CCMP720" /LENGTH=231 /DNA_ID=CAMNT_0041915449 /DNA_START=111 /DNA_END=806 /DNA_ORIENTATION=-